MKREKLNVVLLGILLLFSLTFISSAPPVTQVSNTNGYNIKVPELGTVQVNQTLELSFHVFNASNGVPIDNTSTACYIHVYNSSGEHIFRGKVPYENPSTVSISNDWAIDLTADNFSTAGSYAYAVQCNSTTLGGFQSVGFDATLNGQDFSTAKAISYLGFLIIILLTLFLSLYGAITTKWKHPRNESDEVISVNNLRNFPSYSSSSVSSMSESSKSSGSSSKNSSPSSFVILNQHLLLPLLFR